MQWKFEKGFKKSTDPNDARQSTRNEKRRPIKAAFLFPAMGNG